MTLDEDVVNEIRRLMNERGAGFKETVNDLLRRALRSTSEATPYVGPTFASGTHPGLDVDRALSLAARLEDEEIVRKIATGK